MDFVLCNVYILHTLIALLEGGKYNLFPSRHGMPVLPPFKNVKIIKIAPAYF